MRNRIFGLDLLRAVAIALVLAAHARPFFLAIWPRWLIDLFVCGDVGVDLFFVLSGYLIGGILIRDLDGGVSPRALLQFWSRRWWRTLPNYCLFLVVSAVLALWLAGFRTGFRPYLLFSQSLLWEPPAQFAESWSLCVEEWFYLVFAALTFAFAERAPRGRAYLFAAAIVAGVSYGARAWFVLRLDCPFRLAQHAALLRLDSLMFGVIAAWAAASWPARWRSVRYPSAAIGLVLLAAALALRVGLGEASIYARLLYFDLAGLAVALLLPALSGWRSADGLAAAFVTRASVYSYSLYLVNIPARTVMLALLGTAAAWPMAALEAAGWLVATWWVSWAVHHGYESRMTRLRDMDIPALIRRATRAVSVAAREKVGSR